MGAALKVEFKHSADELWKAYKVSNCAAQRRRLQVLALLAEGKRKSEVLSITRYSHPRYLNVLGRYQASGLEGLRDGRRNNPGAPPLLTDGELLLLAQTIRADYAQGVVWNGKQVQQWVKDTLGKDLYLSRAYEFLDAVQFSQQTPRPQHVEADVALQEEFKKTRSPTFSAQLRRVMNSLNSGAWTNTDSA